jgi:hypothetical protein
MKLPAIEPLLTPRQVAAILQITDKTLKNWGSMKPPKGPVSRKLPGSNRVRYEQPELRRYMVQRAQTDR